MYSCAVQELSCHRVGVSISVPSRRQIRSTKERQDNQRPLVLIRPPTAFPLTTPCTILIIIRRLDWNTPYQWRLSESQLLSRTLHLRSAMRKCYLSKTSVNLLLGQPPSLYVFPVPGRHGCGCAILFQFGTTIRRTCSYVSFFRCQRPGWRRSVAVSLRHRRVLD